MANTGDQVTLGEEELGKKFQKKKSMSWKTRRASGKEENLMHLERSRTFWSPHMRQKSDKTGYHVHYQCHRERLRQSLSRATICSNFTGSARVTTLELQAPHASTFGATQMVSYKHTSTLEICQDTTTHSQTTPCPYTQSQSHTH